MNNGYSDCILMTENKYGRKECVALNTCYCNIGGSCKFYKSKEEYELVSNNLLDGVRKKTNVPKQ